MPPPQRIRTFRYRLSSSGKRLLLSQPQKPAGKSPRRIAETNRLLKCLMDRTSSVEVLGFGLMISLGHSETKGVHPVKEGLEPALDFHHPPLYSPAGFRVTY